MTELEYQERKLDELQKEASAVMDEKYRIMSWGFSERNKEEVDRLSAVYDYLMKQYYSLYNQVQWLKTRK